MIWGEYLQRMNRKGGTVFYERERERYSKQGLYGTEVNRKEWGMCSMEKETIEHFIMV